MEQMLKNDPPGLIFDGFTEGCRFLEFWGGEAASPTKGLGLQAAPRCGRARTVRLKMHFVPNPSNSAA